MYSDGVTPSCFLNIRLKCWGYPCRQPVLGKLDDELADVVARRVSGGLLDDIAEVIGGHAQFVGAILHGGQTEGQLELVLEILTEQEVEADKDVGVLYLSGNSSGFFPSSSRI